MERIEKLRKVMKENELDAFFISSFHNIYYLSHHTSDEAFLFITKDKQYIISDFRYRTQIKEEVYKEYKYIELENNDLYKALEEIMIDIKNVGFEGDYLNYSTFEMINKFENVVYKNIDLKDFRNIKDKEEIENIRKASQIAEDAFNYVINSVVKAGVSEIDIANALEFKMKELGASKPSFDTIVAANKRGALPHAKPTSKKIEDGDMVTIDFGAYYNYYCSDLTRTFAVGNFKNDKLKEIYDIVFEAQKLAISAIKPGVMCSDIDKIARDYIASKGYGENFGHGLGHGIGIQIHESPRFSKLCNTKLEEGMVITVEPGIYVEDLGGVRIEDDIIVTNKGCEIIAKLPKDFMILK